MRSGNFKIVSEDIPNEILEQIISYKLDGSKKKFYLDINLTIEILPIINKIKTNKIEILHDDGLGNILLKRMIYGLRPFIYSTKGTYIDKQNLMTAQLGWQFEEIYDDVF